MCLCWMCYDDNRMYNNFHVEGSVGLMVSNMAACKAELKDLKGGGLKKNNGNIKKLKLNEKAKKK